MTTVVYHSADFDGVFCREVAKRALGEDGVRYLGWNFGEAPLEFPAEGDVVVMDLPLLEPFGMEVLCESDLSRFVWIDHHKTSIDSTRADVPGYRIDGVAACRLAWQWFNGFDPARPDRCDYIDRRVKEPLAIRLAGEYDVWDKRDANAELFQYGLRSVEPGFDLGRLLDYDDSMARSVVAAGGGSKRYAQTVDAGDMKASFLVDWEGLRFLCLNGRGNSLTFASRDVRETGHDALLMFYTNGVKWVVSLYHARHRVDLDLSVIAKKMGGGGHRGACGFSCYELPFMN